MSDTTQPTTPATPAAAPASEYEGMSLEQLFGAAEAIQPTEGGNFAAMSTPELFAAADRIMSKPIYQD